MGRKILQGLIMQHTTKRSSIEIYFHCRECLKELPEELSPDEYSNSQAGWTKKGIQVWCNRHELNIIHLDFLGQKVEIESFENE